MWCCPPALSKSLGVCCRNLRMAMPWKRGRRKSTISSTVLRFSTNWSFRCQALPSDEAFLHNAAYEPVLGTLLAAKPAGSMGYLVTGDKDLLVLADRYPILTPAAFWRTPGRIE
jgi:hypothetical protein